MRRALCVAFSLFLALPAATAAVAQGDSHDTGVVVELFTSQGCSSCPPADAFLAKLADRPDVIALAVHVDYWDYIGWEDRFARPEFTRRQKAYALAAGSRSVYTPQMIVGGTHHIEGLQPMTVMDIIQQQARAPAPVEFALNRAGAMLEIVLMADPPLPRAVDVQLVRYRDSDTVSIGAGENAGRTVTYRNIVTSWKSLGAWDGEGQVSFHVRAEGNEPAVVIVQENGPGPIVAAARTR